MQYNFGRGIPINKIRAYVWYAIADAQGRRSKFMMDELATDFSPEELAQAREQATRCFDSDFQDCE